MSTDVWSDTPPEESRIRVAAHVLSADLGGSRVLIDRRAGAAHELNATAGLIWDLLDGTTPLELAAELSELTGAPREVILADIDPVLAGWMRDGLVRLAAEPAEPAQQDTVTGPVPVHETDCTRSLDSAGWHASLVVDLGSGRTAGLRTSSPEALELAQSLLPDAPVVGPADTPANVSLRWSPSAPDTKVRDLAVAYVLCSVLVRSKSPAEAACVALRGLHDLAEEVLGTNSEGVVLETTALLGPGGTVVLGPASGRHWVANRRSELDRLGVELLPRHLRVLPGGYVCVDRVELPRLHRNNHLDGLLDGRGPWRVREIRWHDLQPGRPIALSGEAAALATLAAAAPALEGEDDLAVLADLVRRVDQPLVRSTVLDHHALVLAAAQA
ncbi:MAG: PqqD family protein [Motilibacteraceae bacterium]